MPAVAVSQGGDRMEEHAAVTGSCVCDLHACSTRVHPGTKAGRHQSNRHRQNSLRGSISAVPAPVLVLSELTFDNPKQPDSWEWLLYRLRTMAWVREAPPPPPCPRAVCLGPAAHGQVPRLRENQQMGFHTVLSSLTCSPDFIDNTKRWFFKHSASLFAMVISVNSSYFEAL